jgi:hypothetical protein
MDAAHRGYAPLASYGSKGLRMRRLASRVLIAALLAGLIGAALVSAALAEDPPVVALGFESTGWAYEQAAYDGEPGFQDPAFDDSAWAVGQAGFGTTDGVCPWNNTDQVHTAWGPGTDMLLRHHFTLPAGASGVHISGTVDNNADVYVNGTLVQHVENGFCTADGINADVPDASIGQDNVVAIRARDLGDATFIDLQITYDAGVVPAGECLRHGAGGWTFSASVSDTDGLVIDQVRLGPRLVARSLSVPYLTITGDWSGHDPVEKRTVELSPGRGEQPLYPSGTAPVDYLGATATYQVNGLPPGVRMWVQQSYRFQSRADGDSCEPSEKLPCQRFWPTLTWGLDDSGSAGGTGSFLRLGSVQAVQRFEFDPDAGGDADLVGRSRGNLFRDNDFVGGIAGRAATETLGNGHLRYETRQEAINFGQRLQDVTWDSWHQTDRDNASKPGVLPNVLDQAKPGCSECIHAHWSWGGAVKRLFPGFTDGWPELWDGSKQDDYIAVVKYSSDPSEIDPWQQGYQHLVDKQEIEDSRIVVFWDATVNGPSDGATDGIDIALPGSDPVHFPIADATWPQLPDIRHGGNGSMFVAPARVLDDVASSGFFATPDWDNVTQVTSALHPRLPAGWVLPIHVGKACFGSQQLQGPFWVGVNTDLHLLNPEWPYSQHPGGTPYVTLRTDSFKVGKSGPTFTAGRVVRKLECGDPTRTAYLVFDGQPEQTNVAMRLFGAPDGIGFEPLVD